MNRSLHWDCEWNKYIGSDKWSCYTKLFYQINAKLPLTTFPLLNFEQSSNNSILNGVLHNVIPKLWFGVYVYCFKNHRSLDVLNTLKTYHFFVTSKICNQTVFIICSYIRKKVKKQRKSCRGFCFFLRNVTT